MKPIGAYTVNSLRTNESFPNICYRYNSSGTRQVLSTGAGFACTSFTDRTCFNSGPGWQQKAALGLLPPTPSALQKVELLAFEPCNITSTVTGSQWTTKFEGDYVAKTIAPLTTLDSIFGVDDRLYALEKAKSRLISRFSDIQADVGVMIGEANQTKLLLGDMSKDLLTKTNVWAERSVKEIQRQYRMSNKTLTAFTNLCDTASSLYLAFIYGVEPLVTDIGNLYDVATTERNRALRRKFRGTFKRELVYTISGPWSYPSLGNIGYNNIVYRRKIITKAGCSLKSCPTNVGDPKARLGLLTSNILPTAYEIIPYSFVVDMFSNIGDMLSSYTYPIPGYSDAWSVLIVEDTMETTNSLSLHPGGDKTWTVSGAPGYAFAKAVYYERKPIDTIMPNLVFTSWDSLSRSGQLNLGALATNVLSKFAHGWAKGLNLPKSWPKPTTNLNFSAVDGVAPL